MSTKKTIRPLLRLAQSAALVVAVFAAPATAEIAFLTTGGNSTALYGVDLDTNEAFFLLDFGSADRFHAITICPGRDTLFAIAKNPPNVVAVDLGAAVPSETVLGSLPASFTNDVVQLSCALDGTLFFTDSSRDELYTLDPLTCPICTPSLVGVVETSAGAGDVDVGGADIEFTGSGDLFLLTNRQNQSFFKLDPSTGLATFIGLVATGESNTGMTAVSSDRLIIHSNDDHLYELDRSNATTADLGVVTDAGTLMDLLHQGGDLAAPIPICVCVPEQEVTANPSEPEPCDCVGTCESSFENWGKQSGSETSIEG